MIIYTAFYLRRKVHGHQGKVRDRHDKEDLGHLGSNELQAGSIGHVEDDVDKVEQIRLGLFSFSTRVARLAELPTATASIRNLFQDLVPAVLLLACIAPLTAPGRRRCASTLPRNMVVVARMSIFVCRFL